MNLILFDWLSFTSKKDSVDDLVQLLGLDPFNCTFKTIKGQNFYEYGMQFCEIKFFYGGNNGTTMCQLSGQGCRDFETFSSHKSFYDLLSVLISDPDNYTITRLDIAYDDHDGVLDIWKLKSECDKQNFVTKFSDIHIVYGCINKDIDVQFGSMKSEIFFRCYDKAKERHCDDDIHWIRFELQLRNSRALEAARQYLLTAGQGIGDVFFGIVNNYIRFVKPSKTDTNKSRWLLAQWWRKFLDHTRKISVYTPCDQEYNYSRLYSFLQNNCGNALAAFIQVDGLDGLSKLVADRNVKPNPKYQAVVARELFERSHYDD